MNKQLLLTAIWLASFMGTLAVIESYVQVEDAAGKTVLIPEDRVDAMKPVVAVYGGYLTGILAFWFLKPFRPLRNPRRWHQYRFAVALACTLVFNAIILYLVSQHYLAGHDLVLDDVDTASTFAGLLSFVVAPVNAYYFGVQ